MDEGRKIWAPDGVHGFVLGTIADLGVDTITVQPLNGQEAIAAPYDSVFPAADDSLDDVDDNCKLMYLNEATLLENVRVRYSKDKIYTCTANILIAVNPYHDMGTLYSSAQVARYKGQSLGTLPPHVFAIADKAYRDVMSLNQSQSIVVSGESGAGKTESTKYIIRYLTEAWGTGAGAIEQRLNEANPVLEAFGNARTLRNHNSSRFGKFVEIHFNGEYKVVGGFVSHYLLEKSRVCTQLRGERNYHIFYQMLAGAPAEMRKKLGFDAVKDFRYVNKEGVIADPLMDDVKAFQIVQKAFEKMGVSESDKMKIYRVVAAVLHLGNIKFASDPNNAKGGSLVDPESRACLERVAELIGLEPSELELALTGRIMTPGKAGGKGTVYRISLKLHEAIASCDAFAKALYVSLFDHVVNMVNQGFSFKQSSSYIGILDIAGFEFYQTNGYEQFCINYCNEKLQQFFNDRVLKEEQELYREENLDIEVVTFADNQDCIDLIEAKSLGIIDLLDEESRLPQSSDMHFCQLVHDKHKNHFRLEFPRNSKFALTKSLRDDEGFVIRHFAGAVCYKSAGFIEKNNDVLHENLEILMGESRDAFVKDIFERYVKSQASLSPQSKRKSGRRLAVVSVGSKFRTQLTELMGKLRSTGASFVRCIKPNLKNAPSTFMGGEVLSQLHSAGMMAVLDLMDDGYPTRTPFQGLHELYKNRAPSTLTSLDAKSFCEALFKTVGMHESDYKFGKTKVFFRPGKFAEFDQVVQPDTGRRKELVTKTARWLVKARWRKAQYAVLSIIKLMRKVQYRGSHRVVIQKTAKMYLAKKKHKPRYKTVSKLEFLLERLSQMRQMTGKLKADQETIMASIEAIEKAVKAMLTKVKSTVMPNVALQAGYKDLLENVHNLMERIESALKRQKVTGDAAKAAAIHKAIEDEKRAREEVERRQRQEEEARKEKSDMEARRKKEEEEAEKREALMKQERAAKSMQEKINSDEDARKNKLAEQERRDHELALRLAQESGESEFSKVSRQSLRRSVMITEKQEAKAQQKHDLSQWKYAELRDIINTSCDIELLEACRVEFHRRLKVYHAWKLKNKKNVDAAAAAGSSKGANEGDHQRAPDAIMKPALAESTASAPTPKEQPSGQKVEAAEFPQRYFRVPFVRPSEKTQPGYQSKGWWYAHFDGNWIARQIDMYPGKKPVILVAGKNDMDMCELSLTETGLTRKKGAEILPKQFEDQWTRLGGPPYIRPANRKK